MTQSILIVDDEKNMLTALEKLLAKHSDQIVKASNGKEGLRKLKKESPKSYITTAVWR